MVTKVRVPPREIALSPVYSDSYREDSPIERLLLWHCAEARKSSTIGQLRECAPLVG